MSGNGFNVPTPSRKFMVGKHGKWPFRVLEHAASGISNLKGNDMPLEKVQLGHRGTAMIKGEPIEFTRVI